MTMMRMMVRARKWRGVSLFMDLWLLWLLWEETEDIEV
jgi:hypothetical protein